MSGISVVPVKAVCTPRDERWGSAEQPTLLSVSATHGVVPRSEITAAEPRADNLTAYKRVAAGEIVVNRMSAYQGALGLALVSGVVSPDYLVLRVGRLVEPRWLRYLFRSTWFVSEMSARVRGIGSLDQGNVRTPRINWSELGQIPIAVPDLARQRAIADHLDDETSVIDGVVAARRRQVDLLARRRLAIISSSLDVGPAVPVRRIISLCTSGPRGWGDLVGDDGVMFIRSANLARESIEITRDNMAFVPVQLTAEAARSRVHTGDTLVGITGANTGWAGIVRSPLEGSYVSQHVAILRPKGVQPDWLAYSIASEKSQRALLGSQYGGTKTQLGLEDLRELVIRVPDLGTQRSVMRSIDHLEADTASTIQAMTSQIDLLVERRQALITAAVTGSLDVQGVAV